MATPPPTDPRAPAQEPLAGLVEVRDPRSQTGGSPRRLRHLIGRLLEVAVLVSIDAVSIGVASAAFWAAAIAIELADPGSASDPVATVALVALMLSFAACIAMGVACLVRVRRVFRATRGTP